MGEHKYNPTAIAAKNGELSPKPKKMSKRELEALMYSRIKSEIVKRTGLGPGMIQGVENYGCLF